MMTALPLKGMERYMCGSPLLPAVASPAQDDRRPHARSDMVVAGASGLFHGQVLRHPGVRPDL